MLGITNLKRIFAGVLAFNVASSLADIIPWSENQFYQEIHGCNGFSDFNADDLLDGFNVKVFENPAGDWDDYSLYYTAYSNAATYYASNSKITEIGASISTMDYYYVTTDIYGMQNIDISQVVFEFTGFLYIEEPGIYLVHIPAVDTGVAVYIGTANSGMSCCGEVGTGDSVWGYTVIVSRVVAGIPAYGTGAQYLAKGYYPIKIVAANTNHNYILDVQFITPEKEYTNIGSWLSLIPLVMI
ncbi:hypothetical protein B5S27_g5748 [[Candida] boidinii]|nr:hypothetical protein B5S27_g5748 [[Candida] boidinii]